MLKRIVVVATVLLATVSLAEAQQPSKLYRIGFVSPGPPPNLTSSEPGADALLHALRELGCIEGKNITIEYRWAEGKHDRLPALAAELVQLKVDVIVAMGPATGPTAKSVKTIPVVFAISGDPVEARLVESLARPGKNMTGITWLAFELVGKRLELLKEAVPRVSRVAVLASPAHPGEQRELRETQSTAQALGTTLQYHQVRATTDFEAAFGATLKEKANALLVFPDPVTGAHRKQIAEFAAKHRLASVFGRDDYVEAGGLMAYGPNREETFRRIPVYVDKILKGAKPADLPVELPMRFEFVVNLKTAKQIGLTIPPNVLVRADKVIK